MRGTGKTWLLRRGVDNVLQVVVVVAGFWGRWESSAWQEY